MDGRFVWHMLDRIVLNHTLTQQELLRELNYKGYKLSAADVNSGLEVLIKNNFIFKFTHKDIPYYMATLAGSQYIIAYQNYQI